MKRNYTWIALAVAALWIASNSRMPKAAPGESDLVAFGKIPVLSDGRNKPFDTVARNSLLILRGKQTLRVDDRQTIDATHWLADVLFNPEVADGRQSFVINNPEVLGLFGWEQTDRKYFSWAEIRPFLKKIDEQGQQVESVESAKRTPYQTGIYNLRNSLMLYQRLKNSLRPEEAIDFAGEIDAFLKAIPAGLEATLNRKKGAAFDQAKFDEFSRLTSQIESISEMAYVLPVPPDRNGAGPRDEWISIGTSLEQTIATGTVDPVTNSYALLGDAYRQERKAGDRPRVV